MISNHIYLQISYNPNLKTNIFEIYWSPDKDFTYYKRIYQTQYNSFIAILENDIYDTFQIEDRYEKRIIIKFNSKEELEKFTHFPPLDRKKLTNDSYLLNLKDEFILFTKYNTIDDYKIEITEYMRGAFLSKIKQVHFAGKEIFIGKYSKINIPNNIKESYIKIIETGSFIKRRLQKAKTYKVNTNQFLYNSLTPQIIHIKKKKDKIQIYIFDRDLTKITSCGIGTRLDEITPSFPILLDSKIILKINNQKEFFSFSQIPIEIYGNLDYITIIKSNNQGQFSIPISISIPKKDGYYVYHFDNLIQNVFQVLSIRI